MNFLKFFSGKKKYKFKVGDVVRITPNPSHPNHMSPAQFPGEPSLLEQANGIGRIQDIIDMSEFQKGLFHYQVNLVQRGDMWLGMYCLEEELELYK